MSSDEETEEEVLNEHNPAPPSERIWMPVYQDEAVSYTHLTLPTILRV